MPEKQPLYPSAKAIKLFNKIEDLFSALAALQNTDYPIRLDDITTNQDTLDADRLRHSLDAAGAIDRQQYTDEEVDSLLQRALLSKVALVEWVSIKEDTDCAQCFYTIKATDPEGMARYRGKMYCTNVCAYDSKRFKPENG